MEPVITEQGVSSGSTNITNITNMANIIPTPLYNKYDSKSVYGSGVSAQQKRLFTKAAVIGARAAWSLNEWSLMGEFVSQLPEDNIDASFLSAVLAIHNENYQESSYLIEQTRRHLDSTITALLAESYGRAYVPLIMVFIKLIF